MPTMTVSLTPNAQTTAVMTAHAARITFQSLRARLWVASLSRTSTVSAVPWTCGSSLARFQSGLTVRMRRSAYGGYILVADGSIVDSGRTHRFRNLVIGSFTP